ncbi:MAG: hypothetical protein ACRENK_08245 [Gemmatimonadaceae bacterium]
MKDAAPLLLVLALGAAFAQEQDIQRALIQRDQQSAEFAAGVRGASLGERQRLENLGAVQLQRVERDLPAGLRPYERQKAADERTLVLSPPMVRVKALENPRPLPGAMPSVVDVIPSGGDLPPH